MCLRPLTPAEGEHRVAEAKQLRQRVESGSTTAERDAGLQGIVQFVEAVGQAAEPFVVPLVPAILKSLGDKVRFACVGCFTLGVAEAAGACVMPLTPLPGIFLLCLVLINE